MTSFIGIIFHSLFLYLIIILFLPPPIITALRKYIVLDDGRYMDTIRQVSHTTIVQCLIYCEESGECKSVNHNDELEICELTTQLPSLIEPSETAESNWKLYYSEHRVRAIDEWQSSTYKVQGENLVAAYASDRNRKNGGFKCAHTRYGYSYWAMEFEHISNVSHIVVYFRNDVNKNFRNAELQFLISSTRTECDNKEGTDCAYFKGPPASSSPPVLITCTKPVSGKFLKIIHHINQQLFLCEVEVYFV